MHESESEVSQSYPTLSDPMNCSLPGSSIHGIFQARVLEWGAIEISIKKIKNSVLKSNGKYRTPEHRELYETKCLFHLVPEYKC